MSGKKDGKVKRNGIDKSGKAKIYNAIKIKSHCPECHTTLQPGDTRCRNKKCNARFETA